MQTLRITIKPAGIDRYDAQLPDGRLLLRATKEPMTDAATCLAALGVPGSLRLVFRWDGSLVDAYRGSVGWLAGRTVKEGAHGPEFRRREIGSAAPATASPMSLTELSDMVTTDDGSFRPASISPKPDSKRS